MKDMENNITNDNSGDQESDYKGFAFRKNHLSRGSIIDGEFSNSICFRESLKIFAEDDADIGQLTVNIDKEKGSCGTTYLVFVSLTEYIEKVKHTSTVFGRVTHDFKTLEESRSDCLQLGKNKIERNVTLVTEGDEYCVSLSFFDGKDWERDSLEITKEDSLTLMGEAANYLFVRFLAQSGKCTAINFLSLLCDGSLHMSRYVSSPIGTSKIGREKREICTMCVKRMLLNPRGKITAEWILTKGAGYILEEKREIPYGSVTHPMMRCGNGKDCSNEGDDVNEEELLNISSPELAAGREEKGNSAKKESKILKEEIRKNHLAETFGDSEAQDKTEKTQAEDRETINPETGNGRRASNEVTKVHGDPLKSVGSDLSEEMISKVSINSDDAFQRKKVTNRTLTEGIAEEQEETRSSEIKKGILSRKSDEIAAKSSSAEQANGDRMQNGKKAAKKQKKDDGSPENGPSDEEEKSENLSDNSSEVTIRLHYGSEKKMAVEGVKRMKYEDYEWPDISHLEQEVEGIVVRAMDDILSDYEKVRRENAKLKHRVRKMSLEEEKLRRKLRGKDCKPHWKLADGVRLITIHKKSSVTKDGKVDQSAVPLVLRWRDDQQLRSSYIGKKVATRHH